ncbi:hypothetical protein [Paracoccus niistensis]|uniref:Uncharacterized protein n=1 Tax=Paracoccus niistensis TaxID=632935 RepID=A0ABV6I4B0_9RHOB
MYITAREIWLRNDKIQEAAHDAYKFEQAWHEFAEANRISALAAAPVYITARELWLRDGGDMTAAMTGAWKIYVELAGLIRNQQG